MVGSFPTTEPIDMERFRVRLIAPNGHISVIDKSFSQVCEMLTGLDRSTRNAFWDKRSVVLAGGTNAVFVSEV